MSEIRRFSEHPSLDSWGEGFMQAARENPRRRPPRLLRPLSRRLSIAIAIAVALPAGAGIAVASGLIDLTINPPPFKVIDNGGPPVVGVFPGDVVGYLDLATGELITCPDGEPLQRRYGETNPHCSDGSVPPTYVAQTKALRAWEQAHAIGTADPQPAENGPNFQVILKRGHRQGHG